jgi:hypothetical protein
MKAKERHHLKQDEFTETAMRVAGQLRENQSRVLAIAGAAALVVVIAAGFYLWKNSQDEKAGVLLGTAYSVAQSAIAPASTLPGAAANTFPTGRGGEYLRAFQQVVTAIPRRAPPWRTANGGNTSGARALRGCAGYKVIDAKQEPYVDVALGLADTAGPGQDRRALKRLTDLSAERDGPLPVDGVLVQLAPT